ncbi:MAG: hypothetical protein P8X74_14430 [Reinekea sp.]
MGSKKESMACGLRRSGVTDSGNNNKDRNMASVRIRKSNLIILQITFNKTKVLEKIQF